MRRTLARLALLLFVSLPSAGCLVVSLHPAYDATNLSFDEALLGTWKDAEDEVTIEVARGPWKSYTITITDGSGEQKLTGYETMIGEERFVDVAPAHGRETEAFVIPAHGVYRIRLDGDRLVLAALDYDWFARELAARRLRALAVVLDEKKNIVLTADTPALRAWLAAHVKADAVFGSPVALERRR